jgi:SH3-like domain-containing protein
VRLRVKFSLLVLFAASLFSGCNRGRAPREIAYVSAPQAFLRDQVAAVYNKTGTVKNGETVQVLGRDRRFARVRTSAGVEGWIEQRYLVSKQTYDAFQKLAEQVGNDPVQATALAHNQTNIHLQPDRDAEHLYQVDQGAKLSLLKRASSEKPLPGGQARVSTAGKQGQSTPAAPALEDWWLIRDEPGHVGWVLGRMLDVDIPLEIAQYAEGQRAVASFVLDQVTDADKKVPQYLVLLTENKDGMPFDFNQLRVFTWNVKRHRYETAYRERNLNGVLPVTISHESFEKEGDLPVFVVHVKDDAGNLTERKYKLNTPIVRRVLAPGEQKEVVSRESAVSRKRKKR